MNQSTISATTRAEDAAAGLATLSAALGRALDRQAAAFGVSDAKLEMLELLARCGDGCQCLHRLGSQLGVTRPNVTKLVDGLERDGLVERQRHPTDKRMVNAHLTAAGATLAARALPGRRALLARTVGTLDDEELGELGRLLDAVAERLGAEAPRGRCG